MDKLLDQLASYGSLGIIAAYFLYNDYQDRKAHRAMLQNLCNQVSTHEKTLKNHDDTIKKHERIISDLEK